MNKIPTFIKESKLKDILRSYKTPFFLFSEKALIENYNNFVKYFSLNFKNIRVDYSVKTNNEIGILKILAKLGSSAEVISSYEIQMAKIAGFGYDRMSFDGPCKTDDEIEFALRKNIHAIYADSIDELFRINRIAKKIGLVARAGIRINLGIHDVLTGPAEIFIEKFGVRQNSLLSNLPKIKQFTNLQLIAISTHLGSQIIKIGPYIEATKMMVLLAKKLKDDDVVIQEINLGGGYPSSSLIKNSLPRLALGRFGLSYEDKVPSLQEYGEKISKQFSTSIKIYNLPNLVMAFQPGRAISSNMGIAVAGIKVKKDNWLFLDISTSSLPESLFFAQRRIAPLFVDEKQRQLKKYNIAGKGLNSADNFVSGIDFPEMKVGEFVAILDAGAYSISRSNRFTVLNPPVYLLRKNDTIVKIRREENYKDVIAPMEYN